MALSAFDDKSKQPQEADLKITLGSAYPQWNDLKKLIAATYDPISIEWGFASKTTGWGLRLKRDNRAILYN